MRKLILAALASVCTFGVAAQTEREAEPATPLDMLIGQWQGSGTYDGNELELLRDWQTDLAGQFVRADMRVKMPDGASFRSLAYWRRADEDYYRVVWMDEIGRMQNIDARVEAGSGDVSLTYRDEYAEGGPAWRRWVFRQQHLDRYSESIYALTDDGWERLAVFEFRRVTVD